MQHQIKFDETDRKILIELIKDASLKVTEIAKKLGMPRTTVQERIERMQEKGIIKRFTVIPDYKITGLGACAFVLASFMPGTGYSQREVAEKIAKIPGVHEVHLISGEWDIMIKVRASSIEEIGRLIIDRIRTIPGVA
ncbi:MAG: Lrp/AsnC family transcriptional regulator, partial [Thermoplasmata archaeon]